MKKIIALCCFMCLVVGSLTACGDGSSAGELYVYNYGEYFDPDALQQFEEETGIKVTYDEYETNEMMYPLVANGAAEYDLVCPSDYMVQRMIGEGLL